MNMFHGLGNDDEAVGKNFLLNFMRCIHRRCIGHVLSILAWRGQKCHGSKWNVSRLFARTKRREPFTPTSHPEKACRIHWNNAAERRHKLPCRWNKLRRRNTGKNKCARWLRAGQIPEDSALDARALQAAPPRDAGDPYRKHRKERACRWNERRHEYRPGNSARAGGRGESPP